MDFDIAHLLVRTATFYVPFLFSLCVHEYAHGWVALKRGDNTAQMMGRLTLNPMAHAHPVGTFILPILSSLLGSPIFFGWANPVPVNYRNLKNQRVDLFWIASAGPLSNILMAFIGAFILVAANRYMQFLSEALQTLMIVFIQLNLFLAVFNLLPIHPLDGGKVIARFIPDSWDRKLQENQQILSMLLMMLFLSGAMRFLQEPVKILMYLFLNLAEKVIA